MEAATYAGLVSLMNLLIRYQHPTCPVSFDSFRMKILLDRVTVLVEFLENHSQVPSSVARKMKIAAYATKDMIESFYVNRLLANNGLELPCPGLFILCPDLEKAIQEFDIIIEGAIEVKETICQKTVSNFSDESLLRNGPRLLPHFEYQGLETASAYAALDSLTNVLTIVQCPTCPAYLDRLQIETLSSKARLMVDILDNCSPTGIDGMTDVEREMTTAAEAAQHMIDSCYANYIFGRHRFDLYTSFHLCPDLQKVIQEMDFIITEATKIEDRRFLSLRSKKHRLIPQHNHQQERLHTIEDRLLTLDPVQVSHLPALSSDLNMSVCGSSSSPPRDMNIMVGLDEQFNRLVGKLTTNKKKQEIISIVGMGGIGKTTLARNVYDCPYIMSRFDLRAWVTISQDYILKEIIALLLRDIGITDITHLNNEELGNELYKGLWGRKYLIILDDIWSCRAWDELRRFIPTIKNGSRILLTTRLSNVAVSIGSCSPFRMKLLDNTQSWELLSNIIFREEDVPHELETLGKKMAHNCKGLPLSIVVLGGLLKISPKTLDYWASVVNKVISIVNTRDNGRCMTIFSLSYNHLPLHLKPCFLYMATFKQDHKILVSELMQLWVSSGLIKPIEDRFLEEVALEYLNDLIDRNLIMVGKRGLFGNPRSCSVHDLAREFCLRESKYQGFICHILKDRLNLMGRLQSKRCLAYHFSHCDFNNSWFTSSPDRSSVRKGLTAEISVSSSTYLLPDLSSFLPVRSPRETPRKWLTAEISVSRSTYQLPDWSSVRKGLTAEISVSSGTYQLPNRSSVRKGLAAEISVSSTTCQLVNFRNLDFLTSELLPSSISLLWNVETLSIRHYGTEILHLEFWKLSNLRHLQFHRFTALSNPTADQITCALDNLQTLYGIKNFNFSDDVIKIIPNLKELSTDYQDYCLNDLKCVQRSFTNLVRLRKLEKLQISFPRVLFGWKCVFNEPNIFNFSPNLIELEISWSYVPWKYMTNIGALPNLVVLKLFDGAFFGNEWSSVEGEFQLLKVLCIKSCDLRIWRADSSHFPRLEQLILMDLPLEEIPLGIGEVPSLELIKLETSKISIIISAKDILDQRRDEGSDDLLVKCLYRELSEEETTEVKKMANDQFQVRFQDHYEDLEDDLKYNLRQEMELVIR